MRQRGRAVSTGLVSAAGLIVGWLLVNWALGCGKAEGFCLFMGAAD